MSAGMERARNDDAVAGGSITDCVFDWMWDEKEGELRQGKDVERDP